MVEPLEVFPEDWSRALAIVAHPDDLEYGAASAVARWTSQGKHVAYLLVTHGEAGIAGRPPAEVGPLREAEERASAAVVGVETVELLDHRDGMIEAGLDLRRDLAHAIRRHRPEVLVTLNHHETWGGRARNMPDHRHVGLAVLDARGDAGNEWVFAEDSPPRWDGVRWVAVAASPAPTHYVDVTDTLDLGVRSLQEHRAYLEGLEQTTDDAADFLRTNASSTGEAVGVRYAVALEVFE